MEINVIMDGIQIRKDNRTLVTYPEDNETWGEYNKQGNIARKMYFDLYQTGRLANIVKCITDHDGILHDDTPVINVDFVIDRDDLDKTLIAEMEEKYPGNGLSEDRPKSYYIPCMGLADIPVRQLPRQLWLYRQNIRASVHPGPR